MKLLQRYVLVELLKVFFFLLSALTVLLVFVGVFREASASGLGPSQAMKIMPYVAPSMLPFTIPATLLLTVCLVYGRMAGDQEITAAKAAGINVTAMLWPSIILGITLSFGSFALTDRVIPWAMGNIKRIVTAAMEDIFLDVLRSQHTMKIKDHGLEISVMGVHGRRLVRPVIQYTPAGRSTITVQAQEATIEFDLDEQVAHLHLVRAFMDLPGQTSDYHERIDRTIPLPFKDDETNPRHMTVIELNRDVKRRSDELKRRRQRRDINTAGALLLGEFDELVAGESGSYEHQYVYDREDLAKGRTQIHSRYALASSCFFFALMGGPIAILQARRQFLTSFFMCFMPILILYYPLVLLMINLSKLDIVSPVWSVWVGNAILLAVGVKVITKVRQH